MIIIIKKKLKKGFGRIKDCQNAVIEYEHLLLIHCPFISTMKLFVIYYSWHQDLFVSGASLNYCCDSRGQEQAQREHSLFSNNLLG